MIIYSKQYYGLHLIFRPYGSAIPRALVFACFATALNALLYYYPGVDYLSSQWKHPYAYNAFSVTVGFLVIFRSNFSYSRYWEARSAMQLLTNCLMAMVSSALAFEASSIHGERSATISAAKKEAAQQGGKQEELTPADHPYTTIVGGDENYDGHIRWTVMDKARMKEFTNQILHMASLMHALAFLHLRSDWKLSNLCFHDANAPAPPEDAAGLPGHKIHIMDVFVLRDDADSRLEYNAMSKLGVIGAITPSERQALGEQFEELAQPTTETLFSGFSLAPSQFRRMQAQKDGIIEEEALENPTPSSVEALTLNNNNSNGPTLEETGPEAIAAAAAGDRGTAPTTSVKTRHRGQFYFLRKALEVRLGYEVPGATERVYKAYGWLHALIARRTHPTRGWTGAAPPTSAGVLNSLKDALTQFETCRKIVDTPFLFPWAQMVVMLLIIFTLTTPLLVIAYVPSLWLSLIVTFLTVLSYWAINEVSRDMEVPFLFDPNDLPVMKQQYNFNQQVLAISEAILEDYLGKCTHNDYAVNPKKASFYSYSAKQHV